MPARLTISLTDAPRRAIWTGFSNPTSIGPITVAPPAAFNRRTAIEAECTAGMISTLAGSERRENG